MSKTSSVYVTDPKTGKETYYPSITLAAEALGVSPKTVSNAIRYGYKCRGHRCRYCGGNEKKHVSARPNICFDCKNACGACSWSAVDPATGKVKFEPVPGWTAEKVILNAGWSNGKPYFTETYHIKACPLFDKDKPRISNNDELTETESRDFVGIARYLVKRWDRG